MVSRRTADVVNNEPLYSPDYLWSGIPLGLTYNFISTDKVRSSLCYGLQWDLEKVAFVDFAENEFGEFVDVKAEQKTQKTRHSIKLYFYWSPLKTFHSQILFGTSLYMTSLIRNLTGEIVDRLLIIYQFHIRQV